MTLLERRAVKIVQLEEKLEDAKKIIEGCIWPGDATTNQRQSQIAKAAKFAGCIVPVFPATNAAERGQSEEGARRCRK